MKFNAWVWLTSEMEGSANGDILLKGLESLVGDTKEYINKLENEIERLENENEKLSDTYCELQEKLDYIEKLEYLLDTNEINY